MPDATSASSGLRAQLRQAIHDQQLGVVAEAALADTKSERSSADQGLLRVALDSCREIAEQLCAEARARVAEFQAAGIACEFDDDAPELRFPQYHEFALRVARDVVTPLARAASGVGYSHPLLRDEAAWADLVAARAAVVLKRPDDAMTRMAIHWRNAAAGGGLAAMLRRTVARLLRTAGVGSGESRRRALGGFLGTPRSLLPALFEFVGLTEQDVLLDIGCGDGRVLIDAARRIGCRCVGVENDPAVAEVAAAAVTHQGLEGLVDIRLADAAVAPVDVATTLFLFVPAESLGVFLPALLPRLRPGTRVVAHEQVALPRELQPEVSEPLFADAAMTVAHLWTA